MAAPLLVWGSAALAQKTPPPAPKPADATVSSVTVVGTAPPVRSDIDRRSYDVAKDLQATSGSVADVLRNVPSVEVDLQGNVSLRGDPNVTILIDGKASGQFRQETRANALQQLPAANIDRIEVITNPSAADNPEGSAGIINIVTKPVRKPGYSGSLRASLGTRERYSAGVTGAYNAPRLTLSTDVNVRGDALPFHYLETRDQPDNPAFRTSRDQRMLNGHGYILNAQGTADYDVTKASHLTAQLRRIRLVGYQVGFEQFASEDAAGQPGPAFDSLIGHSNYVWKDSEVSGTWRQRFDDDGHELTVNLRQEWSESDFNRPNQLTNIRPPAPDVFELMDVVQNQRVTDLKADYTRPLSDAGQLKLGVQWKEDLNDYATVIARGPALEAVTPVPGLTGQFLYRQAVSSVYATYQRTLSDLEVLAGLRLEEVKIDVGVNSGPLTRANSYRRAYPSLHLKYTVADGQKLTASYSRRVQRPKPFEVSPLRTEQDPLNFYAGNPQLMPEETDSFEAGYELKRGATYRAATLFYRRTKDAISQVVEDLGGGVLLYTRANLGESRNAGLELVSNGKLTSSLSYSLSGDLYWNEIDAANLGFTARHSGYAVSGRGSLSWQATDRDLFQADAWLTGRRLTPQGYREPMGVLNLGYRRKLSEGLYAVLTVQDVLNSLKEVIVVDTPLLHDRLERRVNPTVVTLSLTYSFGGAGKKPREPAFDFGGAPPN
jgi:outer membrane receptor protein involved in Fe transport